jgi:hypothetical protein
VTAISRKWAAPPGCPAQLTGRVPHPPGALGEAIAPLRALMWQRQILPRTRGGHTLAR